MYFLLTAWYNFRILMLAKDYSKKREAFGNRLHKYPLHVQTLARMEVKILNNILINARENQQ